MTDGVVEKIGWLTLGAGASESAVSAAGIFTMPISLPTPGIFRKETWYRPAVF